MEISFNDILFQLPKFKCTAKGKDKGLVKGTDKGTANIKWKLQLKVLLKVQLKVPSNTSYTICFKNACQS